MAEILDIEGKYRWELQLLADALFHDISPIKFNPKFINDNQQSIDSYNNTHISRNINSFIINKIIEIKNNLNYTNDMLFKVLYEELKECEQSYLLYNADRVLDIMKEKLKDYLFEME